MTKIAIGIFVIFISNTTYAQNTCSGFFNQGSAVNEITEHEIETDNGKPRYFSVRNYHSLKHSELALYLKSIKNLTQFSERLKEINDMIPDSGSVPKEAFLAANHIIPLIKDFLNSHNIAYSVKTTGDRTDPRIKRTLIVIDDNARARSVLNRYAEGLAGQRVHLVIDPIELFYGYTSYRQSTGKSFEADEFTQAYAISFSLLMHSPRKDFKFSDVLTRDEELHSMIREVQMMNNETDSQVDSIEVTDREASQRQHQQEVAARIQEKIKKALQDKALQEKK